MFNSDVLEVGIGLILFFLLASLIASAVREIIETKLKTRALDLERGIRELLDDPKGQGFAKAFFEHANIFSLFAGAYEPAKLVTRGGALEMPLEGRASLPTYIPAGQFATAIIDLVGRGVDATGKIDSAPITLTTLRARAAELPSRRLQQAVLSAIDHAGDDLGQVKKNLETWFNGTMDRVSGWYKRRTQYWLMVIGVLAAVLFNLDALTVADRLVNDHALRAAAVGYAEKISGDDKPLPAADLTQLRKDLGSMGYPVGWRYDVWRKADGQPVVTLWNYDLQVPLPAPQSCLKSAGNGCEIQRYVGFGEILSMITGWLITAAAISFGAPFWFDVLNKIMVIRSTVKPREKSREEGSADAK
ncbi:hypothetical protein GVN21_01480 [Caulobacter sp. SLTY]|uniref:hypothetical protein n=1 Tax=Caulobacter sp. SLTY TaxID=2683262 RepID=UPI001412FCB3|nr:hypothetical protein [Caulobacter sp. SLTY]NBB14022.1 hypothetical protein [Caulobacter sp. SLTY]